MLTSTFIENKVLVQKYSLFNIVYYALFFVLYLGKSHFNIELGKKGKDTNDLILLDFSECSIINFVKRWGQMVLLKVCTKNGKKKK